MNSNLRLISPIDEAPVTLTAAKPNIPLILSGEFLRITAADEDFTLAINGGSVYAPFKLNSWYRMPLDEDGKQTRFEQLEFKRKAGALVATNNIKVLYGFGNYDTGALAATVTIQAGQTIIPASPANFVTVADVALPNAAATVIVAADVTRREAFITNVTAVNMRVGDSNVAAARGTILPAGQTGVFTTQGAIYCYQASGAATTVPVAYTTG